MGAKKDHPIGMFDSGLGGVSCLGQGIHMLPNERFVYFGDSGVEPYAHLSEAGVKQLCFKACDLLVEKGAKAIVVACNSATSVAITDLRKRYGIPVLGTEPAIKLAVSFGLPGKIVVMATGMTLQGKMVGTLIDRFGAGYEFVKLPCRKIITLVESGIIDGIEIEDSIQTCFKGLDLDTISSVVIGCTHFGFLENSLKKVLGEHIRIADPNDGIIRRLKNILEQENLLNDTKINTPLVEMVNSGGEVYAENAKKMLAKHLLNLKEEPKCSEK
jgi:glutamate racemase